MTKPRISDDRIRALIRGPFVALRTTPAGCVMLDHASRKVGTFAVRYQGNYLCVSAGGDVEGLNAWLVEQQGLLLDEELGVLGTNVENVVEALMLCHEDLVRQGRRIDTGEREMKTFDEVVGLPAAPEEVEL